MTERVLKHGNLYWSYCQEWTALFDDAFRFKTKKHAHAVAKAYGAKVVRIKKLPSKKASLQALPLKNWVYVLTMLEHEIAPSSPWREELLVVVDFLKSVR